MNRLKLMLAMLMTTLLMVSCNKDEKIQPEESNGTYIVSFDVDAIKSQIETVPLSKATSETVWYAIQVYEYSTSSSDKAYAYGLFSDLTDVRISLKQNVAFKIVCAIQKCGIGSSMNKDIFKLVQKAPPYSSEILSESKTFTYTDKKYILGCSENSAKPSLFEGNFYCGVKYPLRNVSGVINLDVTQRSAGLSIVKEEDGNSVDFDYGVTIKSNENTLTTKLSKDKIYFYTSANCFNSSTGVFPPTTVTVTYVGNTYFEGDINPLPRYLTTIRLVSSNYGNFIQIPGISESLPNSKEIVKYL